MVIEQETKQWKLTANDRCDSCNAQAYVEVKGITGELLFCNHHYNKIVDTPVGYEKLMGFMLEVSDERERLIENRLQGED